MSINRRRLMMTQCEGCSVLISQPAKGRRRRFCSDACRKRLRRIENGPNYPVIECANEGCTERFEKWSHNHRFCSATCRNAAQYRRNKPPSEEVWIECASEWCNEHFKRVHPNQRYCSASCRGGDISMFGDPLPEDWGERLEEKANQRRASNGRPIKPGQGYSLPYPGRAANGED